MSACSFGLCYKGVFGISSICSRRAILFLVVLDFPLGEEIPCKAYLLRKRTIGTTISSKEIPPCWNVLR